MQLGVLQALDVWLAEDAQAIEGPLVQAAPQLVQVYANAGRVSAGGVGWAGRGRGWAGATRACCRSAAPSAQGAVVAAGGAARPQWPACTLRCHAAAATRVRAPRAPPQQCW